MLATSTFAVTLSRLVALIGLVLLVASPADGQDGARMGGILKVATPGEPPTLDLPFSTAVLTSEIMWHVNETLFTYDAGFTPVPLLADRHTVSDGGRRYTITLRRGVKFHSGKEMTSADVVASLERWARVASLGKLLAKSIERFEARDSSTVILHLTQPSASLLFGLAEAHAAIYPREVVEAAGSGQLKEFTGTGPYRFVEHRPDRYVRLVRFADYAARSEAPNGFGGRRVAYVDEIRFIPVPDTAVRVAGVETGEYHHAMFVKQDLYDRIRTLPQIESRIVKPRGWAVAVLNHQRGLMTSKPLRQALQAALDLEPIMAAGFGHKDFYRLDPGVFFPEQPWHSTVSAALYNQRDPEKARRLLKEAGYARQPIRWLTSKEYDFMYKNAEVARQQLEAAGFVIDLQVVDWATLNQRVLKPELWDVASTALVFTADPANHIAFRCSWWGGWCHDEKDQLLAELGRETDLKKRRALVDRLQTIFYEDVGRVKLGDYFTLDVARRELRGPFRTAPRLYFWNSWLAR